MAFCAVPSFLYGKLGKSLFGVLIILYGIGCLPTTRSAFSMTGLPGQSATTPRNSEKQHLYHHQQQQQQHYRERREVVTTSCRRPTTLTELKDMFRKLNSELDLIQFLRPSLHRNALSIPAEKKPRILKISSPSERTCPEKLDHLDDSAPLSKRQLCPHYYNILQLPRGYFPPVLNWAVCKCTNCIETNAYHCQPVKTAVSVLKPVGCFFGMQRYEEEVIEGVPVSCACAA